MRFVIAICFFLCLILFVFFVLFVCFYIDSYVLKAVMPFKD